ncbi:hypothetical protein C5E22_08005 [Pectobacterium parmentieri]|nr:hypothetical protein C5E22_08005 [Pectobacterium parmentieri]
MLPTPLTFPSQLNAALYSPSLISSLSPSPSHTRNLSSRLKSKAWSAQEMCFTLRAAKTE